MNKAESAVLGSEAGDTLTVVVVDDEERIVKALQRLLKQHCDVLATTQGSEAVQFVAENEVDVILSDQRMPEMTGVEVLSQVKSASPDTIRILLTGYSDVEAVTNSVNEAEIFRYVTKPWDNDELVALVKEAGAISRRVKQTASTVQQSQSNEVDVTEVASRENRTRFILSMASEALTQQVGALMGRQVALVPALTTEDSIQLMSETDISCLLVETDHRIKEQLTFIKVVKSRFPDIMTVVVMDKADSSRIIDLINEGQIYRYVTHPFSMAQLKIYLLSAMRYHRKVAASPELAQRHKVEEIRDADAKSIGQGFLSKFRAFFKPART